MPLKTTELGKMRRSIAPAPVAAVALALALALASSLTGCGGGGSAASTDAFVGQWTFQTGSISPMCSGITISDIALTGDALEITKVDGTHVAMVIAASGLSCDVTFAVSGSTASVESGQSCVATFDNMSATVDIATWKLTLTGDTLVSSMTGNASVSIISCTPTSTGTLAPSGADGAAGG